MSNVVRRTFEEIRVGDTAEFEVLITEDLVDRFAEISGDINPIHTDEAYAKETPYGKRIVHGMLAGSFFSQLIGVHLPGLHSLYLSQSMRFRQPAFIGDMVLIQGEVLQRVDAARTIRMYVCMKNAASGEVLVDGEALVQIRS